MPGFDFFDITGLPFDPPEKAPKKVNAALDKAEKIVNGALGTATQDDERIELNRKIAYLKEVRGALFGADGKLTAKMDEMAAEKTKKAKARLEAAVRLLKLDGGDLVVTSGTIREQRKKTKLSKESVEEIYKKHGFSIADIDPLAAFPKFPANAELIYKELARLRAFKDRNQNGVDRTHVYDLYDFAAYLDGEPENGAEYRSHDTKDLMRQFDSYAIRSSMAHEGSVEKICNTIATQGKKYVFDSEEHRTQYDQFILYKSPELQELFSILRDSIEADCRDPKFAGSCISIIAKVFPDPETALAIYNREAGLRTDPYIPPHLSYFAKCEACGSTTEFSSFSEAQRIGKCAKCGAQLFKKCKRCQRVVLASAVRCQCGFIFAGLGQFQKYIAKAEEAIRNCVVDDAWNYLEKAKNADPEEKVRTAEIEKKIRALEKQLTEPLQKLKLLVSERKYYSAKNYIPALIRQFPSLDISEYQKQINSALSRCQALYESARAKDQRTKVNVCLDILDICADYAPALEVVQNCPPAPCTSLIATPDASRNCISLSWKPSGERGISFIIRRKEGRTPPANQLDGVLIKKDLTGFAFADEHAEPGKWYTYSVFACRSGICSAVAASASSILYSPVSEVRFEQRGKMIHLSWTAPQNCTGVRVVRTVNGNKKVLKDPARGYYDDADLNYNQTHIYMLTALYKDRGESVETVLTVVPTVIIDSFTIDCRQQRDGQYGISWSIPQGGVDLQIYVNGKIVEKVSSADAVCKLSLPENGLYVIQAAAFSGGKWIKSQNAVRVNTYVPCELDMSSSKLSEEQRKSSRGVSKVVHFSLKLAGRIPSSAVALLVFARDKKGDMTSAPWVGPSEIEKAHDGIRIDISSYREKGEIQFARVADEEDTYYLTLYTVYNVSGKEIYSSPYRRKVSRPLNADVFWKVVRPLFGKRRFVFEIQANRPFVRRPRVVLKASVSGRSLMSISDPDGVTVLDLPEEYFDTASPFVQEIYEPAGLAQMEKNTRLFLFVEQNNVSESFTVRWADGFEGKV